MSLPNNFAMLALSPSIRDSSAFLFLQTGINGMIDMFIQSATGSSVNIMSINSGVSVANTVYVNELGNDNTAQRGSLTRPFATIERALNASIGGDTIEVFPGGYSVTGNMALDDRNYYFHKGATVELDTSGRIHVASLENFNIYGSFYLTVDTSTEAYPIKIADGDCIIEFDQIYCGTGKILISGQNSNTVFKGVSEYAPLQAVNFIVDRTAESKFNNIDFFIDTALEVKTSSTTLPTTYWNNCRFGSISDITDGSPCPFSFSGSFGLEDCTFKVGYAKFEAQPGYYGEVRNTKFNGGIITSGSVYYDNCVFKTDAYYVYPNFSIINNMGGHSVFANCYARNTFFESQAFMNYTFSKSGSASGAGNFNISNAFTSFKPTGVGITINYGSFIYNQFVK